MNDVVHTQLSASRRRALLARLLGMLMVMVTIAACQTQEPVEQAADTVETTAVMVDPPGSESADLEGQTVHGTITLSIPAEGWMKDVRFFLDGQLVLTLTAAPYHLTLDTTTLDNGAHTIGVEARMANNRVRISTIVDFHVANNAAAPGEPAIQPNEPPGDEPAETRGVAVMVASRGGRAGGCAARCW